MKPSIFLLSLLLFILLIFVSYQNGSLPLPSKFQDILEKNCIYVAPNQGSDIFFPGGIAIGSHQIKLDKLPFKISPSFFDPKLNKVTTAECKFYPDKNGAYLILMSNRGASSSSIKIQNDALHDRYIGIPKAYFSSPIQKMDDIELSILLTYSYEGGKFRVGEVFLWIIGSRKIKLRNGELISLESTRLAIDPYDKRLLEIINEVARPCNDWSGCYQIVPQDIQRVENRIKERFFSDLNNLENPEKGVIENLETSLDAFSPR